MLSKKEIRLLEFLIDHPDDYVSSLEIAQQLHISDRTARTYLKQLTASLQNSGSQLLSKPGLGYHLQVDDSRAFETFWQSSLSSKRQLTNLHSVEEAVDRQRFVLNKLLFEGQSPTLAELERDLFISKTTLHSVIVDIRNLLSSYDIELNMTKAGLEITGKETAIRHFIMDYFFSEQLGKTLYGLVENNLLPSINFTEIMRIVIDECRDASLRLSDFVLQNLVLHIALMLQRMRAGSAIERFPISEQISRSKEYQVAQKILRKIEGAFDLLIPEEEANYIALHLKVKLTENLAKIDQAEVALRQQIQDSLLHLSRKIGLELSADQQLFKGILAHMLPLKIRLENGIVLDNPLTEEIRRDYAEVFDLTKEVFGQMPLFQGYKVSDDEWAYLSLHLMAAVERYNPQRKTKVLVVCSTGVGSALMLKNRLEKEFSSSIEIVDVVSYYEVTEERLSDIELIISSVSLSNLIFMTPVITVSVFLSGEDVAKIKQHLQQGLTFSMGEEHGENMDHAQARQIAEAVFGPSRIVVVDENRERMTLLEELTMKLNEASQPGFVEIFLDQVHLRETYSSVVFEETLAFPHPAVAMSYSEQIVVGISKEGIRWGEEGIVHFVFLLSPSKGRNSHIKYISPCLVEFVKDKDLQKRLLNNPTYDELVTIFIPLIQKQK